MANLALLQHYLLTRVEVQVENPAHGRGILAGLPYNRIGEELRAEVQFPPQQDQHGTHEDFYYLGNVVPVLYAPEDLEALVASLPAHLVPPDVREIATSNLSVAELHALAAIVDDLRALGVALNVTPDQYIRRWVHRPVLTAEPQPEPIANQLPLFDYEPLR